MNTNKREQLIETVRQLTTELESLYGALLAEDDLTLPETVATEYVFNAMTQMQYSRKTLR